MDTVITLNKPVGLTPLQAIRQLRLARPELADVRLGYAGRLDPMADGLLLVLAGKANNRQEQLSKLDKTYTVEAVLGIATDSFDVLGLPTLTDRAFEPIDCRIIEPALQTLIGSFIQPYPPYSAVQVHGNPLYWWARQNRLDEVTIPVRRRTIFELGLRSTSQLNSAELLAMVRQRISLVEGDFRQADIMAAWDKLLGSATGLTLTKVGFEVHCSSGTYIRSLVHQFGQYLGVGAMTSALTRTKAGPYHLDQAIQIPTDWLVTTDPD